MQISVGVNTDFIMNYNLGVLGAVEGKTLRGAQRFLREAPLLSETL